MKPKKFGVVLLALLLAAMAIGPVVSAADDNFQLPPLKPDDSQARTDIRNGFSITKSDYLSVIPEGAIIQHSEDGITRVFDSEGKQLSISKDSDSPQVPTPYGNMSALKINQVPDQSYIHIGDNGITHIYKNNRRILTVISPIDNGTPVPSSNGWIEDSYKWDIPQLGQFIADWTVPSSPPDQQTGAINYIFNAIEPDDGDGIVQPVLEYNLAGTHQWTGAPWYVDSNGIGYRGTPVNTAVDHEVRGTLGWNQNLNRWNIIFEDLTTGGYSSSFSTNAPNIGTDDVGAFCALEGYYINDDDDVSGSITFKNMRFRDVNLNPVSFTWNEYTNTNMGLTNLDVTWYGMTPVVLWTNN